MTRNRLSNGGNRCDGVKADGSDCSWPLTHPFATTNGAMRLCLGCLCDLRAKGEHPVYLVRRVMP